MQGKVKWFNNKRGYGFITSDDGTDFFAHFSDIVSDGFKGLKKDKRVSFDVKDAEKGPQAVNIISL